MGEYKKRYFAPSALEIEVIVSDAFLELPKEIQDYNQSLAVVIEEEPDENTLFETGVFDEYSIISKLEKPNEDKMGWNNISPKKAKLYFYKKGLLQIWCDSGQDLREIIYNEMLNKFGIFLGLYENEAEFFEKNINADFL